MLQNNSVPPVTLGNPSNSANTPSNQGVNISGVNLPKTSLAGMYVGSPSSGGKRVFEGGVTVIMNYIAVILSLAVVGLLVFLVIIPQYKVYVSNQTRIVEAKTELDKITAHYNYLKNLESLQFDLYRNIGLAKEAIPEEEDVPQFLNQVGLTSAEAGLVINTNNFKGKTQQSTPENPTDMINAGVISITSSITGQYKDFIVLMELLENARRLVSIDQISMQILDETKLKAYLEKQKLEETAEDDDLLVDDTGITVEEDTITNSAIGDLYFDLNLSLTGYHMKDPDITQLTVEQLVSKQNTSDAIDKLLKLIYYELSDISIESGRDNPFVAPEDETEETEDADTNPQL